MKKIIIVIVILFVGSTFHLKNVFSDNPALDIRDVKSPVDLPFNLLLTSFIIIFIIGLIVLASCVVMKRNRLKKGNKPKVIKMPWEIAYENLENLISQNLIAKGLIKKHFTILSGIIRVYFEDCYQIHAPEMTSEEFLQSLREDRRLHETQREAIQEFLFSCDMVKFAKYTPSENEIQNCYELAKGLIEETKKQKQSEIAQKEAKAEKA